MKSVKPGNHTDGEAAAILISLILITNLCILIQCHRLFKLCIFDHCAVDAVLNLFILPVLLLSGGV